MLSSSIGKAPDVIDNGHRPSVSLTEKGEFVEIHESHLPVVGQLVHVLSKWTTAQLKKL